MLFFDACIRIGPRTRKHHAQPWSLRHALAEMDHCSISGGLVQSTRSVTYDAMLSNRELSEQLAPYPHLFAAWNVMPAGTDECLPADELLREMEAADVRAVTVNPGTNGWDWLAPESEPLFTALASARCLTIVNVSESGSWRDLEAFLTRYPRLPLLLTGVHWASQRVLLPLLRRHRQLHVTFDRLQIHYGPEELHAKGLTDQLVFGSDAPAMSMGAHRAYIDYAEIPEEAKAQIAGGNLARLLHGQQPKREHTNGSEDPLMAAARLGNPLPMPVLDLHMHILDRGLNSAGGSHRMYRGGPEGVFPLLERLGCVGGGFMSWNGTVGVDAPAGNATVTRVLDEAPQGYWGLATVDPTHYSRGEMTTMMREVHADPRFIGMKPYVNYGVEYHDPMWTPWWEYGNEQGFYGLMHRVRNDYAEIDALAGRYPNVRWMVAHCGADYPTADGVIECINKHPNVYAEITLTPVTLGVLDYIVEHAGPDRIVYGSDLPMRDPRQQFGWAVYSRLSLEDKYKLLCTNGLRVIGPSWERLPAHSRPQIPAAFWPDDIPRPADL